MKEQKGKEEGGGNGDLISIDDLIPELSKRISEWKKNEGF